MIMRGVDDKFREQTTFFIFRFSLIVHLPFTKAETLIIEDKSLHEIPVADAKVIAEDSSFFI